MSTSINQPGKEMSPANRLLLLIILNILQVSMAKILWTIEMNHSEKHRSRNSMFEFVFIWYSPETVKYHLRLTCMMIIISKKSFIYGIRFWSHHTFFFPFINILMMEPPFYSFGCHSKSVLDFTISDTDETTYQHPWHDITRLYQSFKILMWIDKKEAPKCTKFSFGNLTSI